jgi:hypothetical protein
MLLFSVESFSMTDSLRIAVLTLEPGMESYTIFGHTAIRITDSIQGVDRIYNYGTFNFNTRFFHFRFLRGDLNYYLATNRFRSFMRSAEREQRKVYEQVLDLREEEKRKIYENLEHCFHSDARYYRYDFFYDNCATRVRDVIVNSLGKPPEYDTLHFCCKTFRQLLKPYIAVNYWTDLGINLVIGRVADRTAATGDFMFLPYYIMEILQDSHMAKQKVMILDASPATSRNSGISYISPWIILVALILLSFLRRTRKMVFVLVLSAAGLMGLFLSGVTMISLNSGFCSNYNIVWMLPSLVVLFAMKSRFNDFIKMLYIAFLSYLLIFPDGYIQALSPTYIPWLLLLLMVQLLDIKQVRQKFTYLNR